MTQKDNCRCKQARVLGLGSLCYFRGVQHKAWRGADHGNADEHVVDNRNFHTLGRGVETLLHESLIKHILRLYPRGHGIQIAQRRYY